MMRPIWSGTISFGLVTIPIKLYSAVERGGEVSFRLLDERTMTPIKEVRVNPETGEEVPWEKVVRGVEHSRGKFVPLTAEELKSLPLPTARTIDLTGFVDPEEIDPSYYDEPYYLAPGNGGEKGYTLLREVLTDRKLAGVGKVALRMREHPVVIRPQDGVLAMQMLRFADELRSPEDVPGVPGKAAKTSAGEQRMAAQLVESMETDFEPDSFRSDYKQALRKLVKAKLEGKALPEPRRGAEVADLQEALRRSLEQTRQKRRRRHVPTRRRARAAG